MLSAGSNVARIVCVNRNMKIANSSHIKRFFHCFLSCSFFYLFIFLRRSGGGNMQFSANSSRLFHRTSESFSKRRDICFLMAASVRSRWLDIGRVLFLRFMELDFISVYKNARKQRGHINWTTLINRGLIICKTDFKFIRIKNDSFLFVFREPGKNAICVWTTINPRVFSVFSFFWFSSAAFFHRRHCPKVTNFVSPLHALFPKRAREADSGINQNTAFASYCPRALPAK